MNNKPYQPIGCALHDQYEIAIMHKKQLKISWSDNDGRHTASVLPKDILVKDRQEFLIAELWDSESQDNESQDKNKYCIRLDRITLLAS